MNSNVDREENGELSRNGIKMGLKISLFSFGLGFFSLFRLQSNVAFLQKINLFWAKLYLFSLNFRSVNVIQHSPNFTQKGSDIHCTFASTNLASKLVNNKSLSTSINHDLMEHILGPLFPSPFSRFQLIRLKVFMMFAYVFHLGRSKDLNRNFCSLRLKNLKKWKKYYFLKILINIL